MSKSEADEAKPTMLLNKDLIKQFDKVLSVSCHQKADHQKKSCRLTGRGVKQGSVQRSKRRLSRKKKVFVLRPSRLKVDPVKDISTPTSNHFSFEKCSKELESILAPSSSSSCSLRPRSASLPSHQPNKSSDVLPKSTTVKKSLVKKPVPAVKDRAVKKRKHLSPPGEEEAKSTQRKTSTCAQQAAARQDIDIDRLADYLEESVLLPKKMSYMAEMMYT